MVKSSFLGECRTLAVLRQKILCHRSTVAGRERNMAHDKAKLPLPKSRGSHAPSDPPPPFGPAMIWKSGPRECRDRGARSAERRATECASVCECESGTWPLWQVPKNAARMRSPFCGGGDWLQATGGIAFTAGICTTKKKRHKTKAEKL